jgi:RNA ligase (TIGR02306 family)
MGDEIKRKLASIQRIEEVRDIEGADAIQAYRVLGWWVVDKKDAHNTGDLVVYLSIDSWVPHDLAPFLSKGKEPREYGGVGGERLRTVRLRGQISQGLLLKPDQLVFAVETKSIGPDSSAILRIENLNHEGADLTEILGIQKWEAPIPAQLSGQVRGAFPSWGRKTDQERCQNIWDQIEKHLDTEFEVTIKLDGSSCTFGWHPEDSYVVCSRNLSLITDQPGNSFVSVGQKYSIGDKLNELTRPIMISGELVGPGIQKNQEKLKEIDFYVFDVYDPVAGKYLSSVERMEITTQLGLKHVPVLYERSTLRSLGIDSLEKLINFADGPSMHSNAREGLVFKSIDGSFSFKAISNQWLIKND